MQGILWNIPDVVQMVALVIAAFSILATMTPNKSDDKIMEMLLKGINLVGGNFGKAKNPD